MNIIFTPLVIDLNEIIKFLTILCLFSIPCLMLFFDDRQYSRKLDQFKQSQLNHRDPDETSRCENCPFRPTGKLVPAIGAHGQEGDTGSGAPSNSR